MNSTIRHTGEKSISISSASALDQKWGAIQLVAMEDLDIDYLKLTGWSAAQNVESLSSEEGYSISLVILFQDKSFHFGKKATFARGTHDWEEACFIVKPHKPVSSVAVFINFRDHQYCCS